METITIMAANNKTREDEATEYLQKHRIIELFNNLTSQLIYQRPGIAIYKIIALHSSKIFRLHQIQYKCHRIYSYSQLQSYTDTDSLITVIESYSQDLQIAYIQTRSSHQALVLVGQSSRLMSVVQIQCSTVGLKQNIIGEY